MWWLDPGKEVLNVLFNRILAPYVENLDMNQVSYGIGQGRVSLRNLRLKKGALDKFRLPIDVLEGYLGTFTLSLHWMNLGNQPVEILIEDIYLLVVPSSQANVDPEEEEQRVQASKAERLENAELLHMRDQVDLSSEDSPQSKGLWASLIAKIINNLQVTVKNIHIRYEDKLSVPGHPFAAGITLAGFNAVSVDENWKPVFIESTAGAIHKLSNLQSLAVYFDTDSASMSGLPPAEAIKKFTSLISQEGQDADHQFILKPVSGEGRITMNHKLDNETPRFDVQLLFNEIGIALDDNQYRDAISLVDMYHVYTRQHQYRKFRPPETEFVTNRAKARLMFAGRAILAGVHERNRQWTWAYFAERRDDRNTYVKFFQKRLLNQLSAPDSLTLQGLEKKLSYEDIRFYRSITRSHLRKDTALRKRLDEERQKQDQASKSWTSWLWGSSQKEQSAGDTTFGSQMTDEQRKELYDVLDYDERAALAESFQTPRDALKTRILAKLNKGSFVLRTDPHHDANEIVSVVFNMLQANIIQRPDNFEAFVSLGGFGVLDGTTKNSLHPQIVHVKGLSKELPEADGTDITSEQPFFSVKFENNPLDERADTALTVRLRHMEVIYHRGYVEAVQRFFKPPASQLESVEALLNVASETLEGLRKDTRAGLEYVLQTHKTIDLQMDLNAPVIIIPEDITTYDCKHLVIDAGHIAIESDLADQAVLREIYNKRSQKYNEDDYKRLESMMYDKMSLRLEDAQFLIGNDLQSCRDALTSQDHSSLHLLERTSLDFQVQNSIVPSVVSLARFKISGNLNGLQVNFSDAKYKSLMRLIDVCIPKFDDDDDLKPVAASVSKPTFHLPSAIFRKGDEEYNVEEEEGQQGHEANSSQQRLPGSSDGTVQKPDLYQHIVEFDFKVHNLRACILKSNGNGGEKLLGDVVFERFALTFSQTKFDMRVDINLRSLSMHLVQPGMEPIKFVSSAEANSPDQDLLTLNYKRVQKSSPEFATVYEGFDQSVDIRISTFIFCVAPEPVVALYDFIMATFVPQSNERSVQDRPSNTTPSSSDTQTTVADKIRVIVRLASVKVILVNDQTQLATLSLSTADVTVILGSGTMRITGQLGNLSLSNDSQTHAVLPEFNQIVSIEGDNLAEFGYETFDPHAETYAGISSSVYLKAGSIKCHFLEQPLHDVYLFISKLAKLKVLYDAATQVAVQKASEIERMLFEISVKSPILIFPSNPAESRDGLVMRLGEISSRNAYESTMNKIAASLHGIQLTSSIHHDGKPSVLKIIDDIDITAEIVQTSKIDRNKDLDYPDSQINVHISDVKLHLTKVQYVLLINLSQSIPRVLAGAPEGDIQAQSTMSPVSVVVPPPSSPPANDQALVDLQPELRLMPAGSGRRNWTTIDLVITVAVVKLHMYDSLANTEADFKEHGIARFALNNNTLRLKMLSDGSGEIQVILKSFTMSNTRIGNSKFREIIPAAQHDRDQFMLLYTMSGGSSGSSLAILTIDSPQIIFAIDPVFALLEFFTIGNQTPRSPSAQDAETVEKTEVVKSSESPMIDFRVDLHDVSINVLENDANPTSDSIRLTINQVLLSQQGILALTVNRLGMSLMQMGEETESVRFLDDVDLTFSLDNRASSVPQITRIDIAVKPVVFRASYSDFNMMAAIANKAASRYGSSQQSPNPSQREKDIAAKSTITKISTQHNQPKASARVVTTKEMLTASLDGLRLVLIGEMQEQPMLHLKIKPFSINVKDWTEDLRTTTTMTMQISYWNLTNSHWEPLIDPWTFTTSASRDVKTGGMDLKIFAQERFDLNLSTTFAELALTTVRMFGKESERVSQRARGAYAPYRIWNRSGCTIAISSDSGNAKQESGTEILHEKSLDWRFDDWKTMRDHVSTSPQHSIKVSFPGKDWEPLQSIPVDREGEYVFSLRIRLGGKDGKKFEIYPSRLLCEVRVEDNIKVVTIRSTYRVENQTLYPLELILSGGGSSNASVEKIVPARDYALPIEAVVQNKIKLRPDQGFGYKWSSAIRWEDLIARKKFTILCPHTDPTEPAFRFQAWAEVNPNDERSRGCPRINLKLRAPIELENLLPYDIQYRIFDKNTDQNWRSYLRKGGIMPVHSVELDHLVMLSVDVQDTVFGQSEFAIINNDGRLDFDIENRLTLQDAYGRKLDLKLNYVRYPQSGGAFRVQIYSPYLIINKTGLPFAVKSSKFARTGSVQDVAGDTRSDVLSEPIPFLLSHPHSRGHEFCLRVANSTWSKTLSFEAPAGDIELVIPCQNQKAEEVHVGLSWTEGLGKYKLTKVITLAPRFLIRNNLSDPLCFRAHGVAPQDGNVIEPGQRLPLHFLRAGQERFLTVAYPGLNTQWSPPINIEDIGLVHFRLRRPVGNHQQQQLVLADSKIEGSTIFVSLCLAEAGWPFIIENNSDYEFSMCQTDSDRTDRDASPQSKYTLIPHSTLPYAWDYPAARDKKIQLIINGARRTVDIKEIGALLPFKFQIDRRNKAVSLDVRADGHKQVLNITNYNARLSIYKPKARNTSTLSRQDTISSTAEAFEAISEDVPPTLTFHLQCAGIGLSLVNRKLVEVIYVSVDTLKFEYTNSPASQSVNLSCATLQIDNQLHEALYPVILQPTPITRDASEAAAPTVQGSVIWLKDQEHGVIFIKYCSILLQALTIETDEDLLFAIYDLTQIKGVSWEDGVQDVLIQHPEEIPEPSNTAAGEDLYFEILELQPIQLSLSFMRTERVNSDEKLSIRNPLAVVVNALTMAVGNVNDAPLELNALVIKDMRLTLPELQNRITYHYRQDVLRQLYRILGSADFIGNPVGLFTNVSSGVADIFYEPFNGVVMHGNKELGIGIAKGAASFVKKTLFGFSDSMTKFTSSVGKGLSTATFDSEYQARRRMKQRRNRPRHAIYGMTAGGQAFASSLVSAMEGVMVKPIEGAESGGAVGFFKGIGKGLVGAVTKPVVGAFDLASNISEGVRNTTTVFDNPERDRARLPRHTPADGILRPYSERDALGQYMMKDLENGSYRKEAYVAHIDIPGGDNIVLLTATRILSFWSKRLRLDWDLAFGDVQSVLPEPTGIVFVHKGGPALNKFIIITNKPSRTWFFNEIVAVVKAFNQRRRMDA